MRRLVAILLIAALAAPGLWWRSAPPPAFSRSLPQDRWRLIVQPLALAEAGIGEAKVVGAWTMTSDYPGFGAYSSLTRLGDGRLLATSDTGRMLIFSPPGAPPSPTIMDFFAGRPQPNKFLVDIEAVTRDPASGRIWVAYEGSNAIERFEADYSNARRVQPAAMREWPGNSGPEGMVRLRDGRFLVLSEARDGLFGGAFAALLFPSDPVDGGEPLRFSFEGPPGFRPVDLAQAPDGRVLLLLRQFNWVPPGFENRIVVADPGAIRAGAVWRGREIATITDPLPTENYEGLAAAALPGGAVRLWLISDDNMSALQRTQLMELRWSGK